MVCTFLQSCRIHKSSIGLVYNYEFILRYKGSCECQEYNVTWRQEKHCYLGQKNYKQIKWCPRANGCEIMNRNKKKGKRKEKMEKKSDREKRKEQRNLIRPMESSNLWKEKSRDWNINCFCRKLVTFKY